MGHFRTKFLRDTWELIGRSRGSLAQARLSSGLPQRLLQLMAQQGVADTVTLEEAEEFFGFADAILGEKSCEQLSCELAARTLAQNSTLVVGYDLLGTVQRLRGWLLGPFVGVETTIELETTAEGFRLSAGVNGQPRATRLLNNMALGAVVAAERFAMETSGSLRLDSQVLGDRCRIKARYRSVRARNEPVAPVRSVWEPRPTSSRPAHLGQLSAEVEQILASARHPDAQRLGAWSVGSLPEAARKTARHSPSGMMKAVTPWDGSGSETDSERAHASTEIPASGTFATHAAAHAAAHATEKTRSTLRPPPAAPSGHFLVAPAVKPKVGKEGA